MDEEDQKDIIEKVKTSGDDEGVDVDVDVDVNGSNVDSDEQTPEEAPIDDFEGEEGLEEGNDDNFTSDDKFGPDENMWETENEPLVDLSDKNYDNIDIVHRSDFGGDAITNCCGAPFIHGDICTECGEHAVPYEGDKLYENDDKGDNPCWDGYEMVGMKEKGGKRVPNCVPIKETITEAEYQGKKVKLNKPMRGDVKKYKVYVKNDKGNVVKVNFGDPNMEIKRDDPERRKSFRARHNCDNPGPKWKARYWSCKFWSTKSVSDLLDENLQNSDNLTNFVKKDMSDIIKNKLDEMVEPDVKPQEPIVIPETTPSPRRKRIWEAKPKVNPKPKAKK